MPVIGRLMYLVLGVVLCLLALSANAQPVTRAEFDALKAQHLQLVRYTADLATGMLRMDERRKALEVQTAALAASDQRSEAQIETHRLWSNAQRDWIYNLNNCFNGLVSILSNAGVPQYIADPAQRKSCVDPTQPAPRLAGPMPPWK